MLLRPKTCNRRRSGSLISGAGLLHSSHAYADNNSNTLRWGRLMATQRQGGEVEGQEKPVKKVMGIFAHPDDPEFFCGGTFARWAAEGAEIVFVLATSGDKGSADPEMTSERLVAIREEEERNAAKALGVKDVIFLRYKDGELEPNLALRRDIVRQIRLFKPTIALTGAPT